MKESYWAGLVTTLVKAWFLAAARTRLGPPMSINTIAWAGVQSGVVITLWKS